MVRASANTSSAGKLLAADGKTFNTIDNNTRDFILTVPLKNTEGGDFTTYSLYLGLKRSEKAPETPKEPEAPEEKPGVDSPDKEPPVIDSPDKTPPVVDSPDKEPPVIDSPDKTPPVIDSPDKAPARPTRHLTRTRSTVTTLTRRLTSQLRTQSLNYSAVITKSSRSMTY